MDYNTKYYSLLNDHAGNVFKLNLNFLNWTGGTSEIRAYDMSQPLVKRHYGGSEMFKSNIHGSSMDFSFFVYSGQSYNDILESFPKEIQMDVWQHTGTTSASTSIYHWDFDTNFDGWFNTANLTTPSTGGTTSNWLFSSNYGGSLQNTTVDNFGTKSLRISNVTLGHPCDISIKWVLPNSPVSDNLSMRMIIRDSSNNQLFNNIFTVGYDGTEQTTTFSITDPADYNNADHILIAVSSTDYDAGDVLYITDVEIVAHIVTEPVLLFRGWVQLDNISTSFIEPSYFITLNATDGLADLKNIDFPYTFYLGTGQTSVLKLIKACLVENGIDLDFKIQCNLSEIHAATGATFGNILNKLYVKPERFYAISNGNVQFKKCYEAIEMLLKPYDCKLIQLNGYWHIYKADEIESPIYIHDWVSLSGVTSMPNDRLVSVTGYTSNNPLVQKSIYKPLPDSGTLTKLPPPRFINTTVKSTSTGTYVNEGTINGTFRFNTSGWAISNFPHDFNDMNWDSGITTVNSASGRMKCDFLVTTPIYNDVAYVHSGGFQVLTGGAGSLLTVSCTVLLESVVYSGSPTTIIPPKFRIELVEDNGEFDEHDMIVVDSVEKAIETGVAKTFFFSLRYENDVNHKIRLCFVPYTFVNSAVIYFDDIRIFRNYDDSTHLDYVSIIENTNNSRSPFTYDRDICFSDSNLTNEGSIFFKPSGLTTTWSTYGKNERLPIDQLGNLTQMSMNQKFNDFVRLSLMDYHTLDITKVLLIRGKKYYCNAFGYDYRNNLVDLEIIEYTGDDQISTVLYDEKPLNLSDGNPLNS